MANQRLISSGIFEDEFTGRLLNDEFKLWVGMIVTVADDQGRMLDNAVLLRAKIFMYSDIDLGVIESALVKLNDAGRIVRYSVGGKSLIQLVNWWKHQKLSWAAPSDYPPPEGWIDREKKNTKLPGVEGGTFVKMRNWKMAGGFSTDGTPDDIPMPEGMPEGMPEPSDIYLNLNKNLNLNLSKNPPDGGGGDDPAFEKMRDLLETIIGFPATPKDIPKIDELVKMGVIEDDIKGALAWRRDNKLKPLRSLSGVFAGCKYCRDIRLQNGNASPPKIPDNILKYIGS